MKFATIGGAYGAALMLAFAGCAGVPSAAPTTASVSSTGNAAIAHSVAGRFSGTIDDNVRGHGDSSFDLAQTGNNPGGFMRETIRSNHYQGAVALQVTNSETISGTIVMLVQNQACTFDVTGRFNDYSFVLTGRYKAIHNCAKETGIFTLKEDCYYVLNPAPANRISSRSAPKAC